MDKQQVTSTLKKPTTILLVGILIVILSVGIVAATGVLWVPSTNNLEGEPLTPTPIPTATPAPPTPTPVPEPQIASAVLTGNDTVDGEYIFFRGDTLHITVTCNMTGIRDVNLYNFGNYIATAQTNAAGTASFDRVVFNPYNYTATIYNEIP